MSRAVPTFVVAGAARSGTTALVEGLRTHPGVFVTEPKEPHYFAFHRTGAHFTGPGDDHTINRVAVTAHDDYLSLYPSEGLFPALGDASVSTMYRYEEALPEMLRMNPEMRVVLLLREPVARAFSSHQYMRARGLEPVEDFMAAVELEAERKRRGWHHLWHYTSMSRYADALEAIRGTLAPDRVGVWFYDDLEGDYEGTISNILRFLEVPPVPGEGAGVPRVNVSGRPRYPTVQRAIAWATGHERVRSFVKARTTFRLRERVRRAVLTHDPIPGPARQLLGECFRSDLERVAGQLDGPLPGWLPVEPAP